MTSLLALFQAVPPVEVIDFTVPPFQLVRAPGPAVEALAVTIC